MLWHSSSSSRHSGFAEIITNSFKLTRPTAMNLQCIRRRRGKKKGDPRRGKRRGRVCPVWSTVCLLSWDCPCPSPPELPFKLLHIPPPPPCKAPYAQQDLVWLLILFSPPLVFRMPLRVVALSPFSRRWALFFVSFAETQKKEEVDENAAGLF